MQRAKIDDVNCNQSPVVIASVTGVHKRPNLTFDLPTGNVLNSSLGPEVDKLNSKRVKLAGPNPVPAKVTPSYLCELETAKENDNFLNISTHSYRKNSVSVLHDSIEAGCDQFNQDLGKQKHVKPVHKSKSSKKFIENQITSNVKNAMDEQFIKQINSTSSQFGEITLKDIYHQCRRTREDVVIIKNILLGSKTTESEWAKIKDSFPFVLPLDNEDDAEACENFISISNDNKEKLVSFYSIF